VTVAQRILNALMLGVVATLSRGWACGDTTDFKTTIANKNPPLGEAPGGMVWIPGGEFSMGAAANGTGSCEMPMASNDAGSIHRVRVGTRGKGEVNTGTNHLGFRCVQSALQHMSLHE
jgi:formylglycine-generating enzyme required for sulfatase activity